MTKSFLIAWPRNSFYNVNRLSICLHHCITIKEKEKKTIHVNTMKFT